MARLFGLSRTRAADLISDGHVSIDGAAVAKSDRLVPGTMIEVAIPSLADPLEVRPEIVEGIKIIHDDDSIVVIDKPVGVAVHPSPGWSGPTVVGHLTRGGLPDRHERRLRAAGHRAAPRRRHVGRDGDLQGRAGVLRAQERLPPPHGRQGLPRAGAGPPRPARGHHRRPDRPAPEGRLQVRRDGRRPPQRHPLRDARGAPVRLAARGAPRDRPHPPDPGAHERAEAPVRRRPDLRRRPGRWRSGSASSGSGCTPYGWASSTPTPASTSSTSRPIPTTSPTPSPSSAMPTDASLRLRPAESEESDAWRRCTDGPGWPPRRACRRASTPPRRTAGWFAARLRDGDHEAWVAEDADGLLLGYALLTATWLDHLFVEPERQSTGVGGALLDVVKGVRPDGFCLWVFESNVPRPHLLRAARARRARAHRRLGQRGEGPRRPDGLARPRPGGVLPRPHRRGRRLARRAAGPASGPDPRRPGRQGHPRAATPAREPRSPSGWPAPPPSSAPTGWPGSCTRSSPRASTRVD